MSTAFCYAKMKLILCLHFPPGLQLQVVVNSPPDFTNSTERHRLDQMVAAFEFTEFTMAHNATMFWLIPFDAQLKADALERNISMPEKLGKIEKLNQLREDQNIEISKLPLVKTKKHLFLPF
jgi:hypothetical protein